MMEEKTDTKVIQNITHNHISPISIDLTEVANKAYDDIVKPAIDLGKVLVKALGRDFIPFYYRSAKEVDCIIEGINKEFEEKTSSIPNENKTEFRTSIIGPAIDVLKYNLEEEHIREMFINILVSEMDNRKQSKVLPAYTEIIKQLSNEDAQAINILSEVGQRQFSILTPITCVNKTTEYYTHGFSYLINDNHATYEESCKISNIVTDNLIRLGIIKIIGNGYLSNDLDNIVKLAKDVKEHTIVKKNSTLEFNKSILEITDFGIQFINICCG